MSVLLEETTLPDNILESILPIFQQCDLPNDTPPTKRRKVAKNGPKSLSRENGIAPTGIPVGYIPLARLTLRMKLPANSKLQQLLHPCSPMRIPVLIKSQITALPSPSADLQQDSGGEISRVDLQITDLEGRQLLPYSCENSQLFELLEQIELASRLTPAERFISRAPTVCYQAHLCTLPNGPYLGLETVVLWADSLEVPDIKYMQLPVLEVFTKYVLQQEFSRPTTSTEQRELRESLLGVSREWTPREFYDSVHVPQTPDSAAASLRCPGITCDLFPFQKRAVRWLLRREGKDVQQDGRIVSLENPPKSSPPASFDSQKDADGRYYYFSQMFMTLTTDTSQWHDAADHLRGGILAEEMGLGKTVEMIALMCLNRREPQPKPDPDGLKYSGATLIITPPAILEQWKQELEKHAPSLRVYYYPGITAHRERQNGKAKTLDDEEMVNELAEADVVLTTYTVISKEIHYAGAVKRNLRHEKRFEQRKTPLIRISWWRVCLDEAQMIESGVSHAAQVARVIPREIAWAVTGTPLRKNIDDLFGLLLFLHYGPYCYSNSLWKRLYSRFGTVLVDIIGTIALRHSKDRVRDELRLPPQKRIVITTPFTAIEEQHYGQLFEQMSMECGLNTSGAPLRGDWDPDDPRIIEKMRSWLTRLRQTCLHPDIGGNNRRTLGSNGPLRTVNEVLDVMIEANEAAIRSEERILLLSQLRRGQLLENAKRRQEALDLWQKALDHSTELVEESRKHLRYIQESEDHKNADNLSEDAEEADKNSRLGQCRLRLRGALEVQHIAVFFTANAYYQIKSDPNLTQPDSDEFKALEKREEDGYEAAKVIRKEMLTDISRKVERHMKIIKDRIRTKQFVNIPKMKPQIYSRGIEAYDLICNFEDLCEALNKHSEQYKEWRDVMIKLVSQSLIDQEDEAELEGNEYERSTKHQDEMYVYMEALRAMYADRHDCLTGQKNILISHEVKAGIIQAQKDEGPSPKLFLEIMNTRSQLVPDPKFGSLRKVVSDLRSLLGTLHWQANSGNSRARAEHEVVEMVLRNAGQIITEQLKVSANLEKEVEMFRDAMNNRLEYYRHLQQISDTVAPYDEEAAGQPLDEEIFAAKLAQEEVSEGKISTLKSKARYLIHLRDDGSSDPSARICIICQSTFETGVLTVCGHKYCTDCLRLWWRAHRTCPMCKRNLKHNDFHQITYKPQDLVGQEEDSSARLEGHSQNAIYADISSGLLNEIKNVDLDGSYGTKIDTLARHIIWLRAHDPGAKSIVFSQYKSFLMVLKDAFDRFGIESTSVDSRGGIEKFKNNPATECFLLHGKAQSSGLTLINATHVFLCEPLINTAIELQAIARVHRIGQHRPTTVWMYLVSGTVEESIYELSVTRRLAHIAEKERHEAPANDRGAIIHDLTETAIDSANSMEIQDSSLGNLMQTGAAGGELVKKDDLWQCLFGNTIQKGANDGSTEAERDVGRFLRGEAAEQRRDD